VDDGEKLLTYLNSVLKVLLGLDIFPRGTKKSEILLTSDISVEMPKVCVDVWQYFADCSADLAGFRPSNLSCVYVCTVHVGRVLKIGKSSRLMRKLHRDL
jgi:hypothetical protein